MGRPSVSGTVQVNSCRRAGGQRDFRPVQGHQRVDRLRHRLERFRPYGELRRPRRLVHPDVQPHLDRLGIGRVGLDARAHRLPGIERGRGQQVVVAQVAGDGGNERVRHHPRYPARREPAVADGEATRASGAVPGDVFDRRGALHFDAVFRHEALHRARQLEVVARARSWAPGASGPPARARC